MDTVITVQEAGIDWITATARQGERAQGLAMVAEQAIAFFAERGYKRRRWAQWGFLGESVRFVSFGYRADEVVCVLSGSAADVWFPQVCKHADHISRLDLQVTVKTHPPRRGVAVEHYRQFIHAGPHGRRGATTTVVQSSDGGSTCYLGKRISDKFLRIYDKHAESGEDQYAGCWRYELECKNEVAGTLATHLLRSSDRPGDCARVVHKHCSARGGNPIYSSDGEGLYLQSPRPPTDIERQCDWLSTNVGGTAREVATCLGVTTLLTILGVEGLTTATGSRQSTSPHGNHAYENYPMNGGSKLGNDEES